MWIAAGLSGLLAAGLLIDVVLVLSEYASQWLAVTLALPTMLLAAGYGGLTWALFRARDTAPWAAGTLAVCTVIASFADVGSAPGVLTDLGAVLLAGVLAGWPAARTVPRNAPPAPLRAARTAAHWLGAGAVAGLFVAWSWAAADNGAAAPILSGILFLAVAVVAEWAAPQLTRIAAAPDRRTVQRLRTVLAAALVPGLLAAVLAGIGQALLLAVVALNAAMVVAVLVPTATRMFLGDPPLPPVQRLDAALARAGAPWPGTTPERIVRAAHAALPARVRTAPMGVKAGAGAALALLVVVVVVATSSDTDGTAVGALAILIGIVSAAAVFTPTMPPIYRMICAGGAVLSLFIGFDGVLNASSTTSDVWIAGFMPLLVVGYAVTGALQNRRDGVTSSAPGWAGAEPRVAPPGPAIGFLTPVTAKGRSQIRLTAATALGAEAALALVSRCTSVRGNAFVVNGDRVTTAGGGPGTCQMVIGDRAAVHARFTARAQSDGGVTRLQIGGLDHWTQKRSYYLGFIPAGPAHVVGYWMYTLYLQTVASELRALDPHATVHIGSPR